MLFDLSSSPSVKRGDNSTYVTSWSGESRELIHERSLGNSIWQVTRPNMAAVMIAPTLTPAILNTMPSPWSKPSCRRHPQGGHHQHHHLATVITVLVTREAQCEWKGPILQLQGMCPGGPFLESDRDSLGLPADQSRGSSTTRRSSRGATGAWVLTVAVCVVMEVAWMAAWWLHTRGSCRQ